MIFLYPGHSNIRGDIMKDYKCNYLIKLFQFHDWVAIFSKEQYTLTKLGLQLVAKHVSVQRKIFGTIVKC